jgi:CRP-like cAMP-binding protein
MTPDKFSKLVDKHGKSEQYKAGEVFHAQDFPGKLFILKRGYVKRYQATKPKNKVLELLYGPGHIVSLSQLYKMIFGVDQNQEHFIYVYQAITDLELRSIDADMVIRELEKDPELYKDFFYESGLKLRSNIFRLASNSIKDDYKKVAHQIICLAYEFAGLTEGDTRSTIEIPVPQTSIDIAEQLNMSEDVAEAIMRSLCERNIIEFEGGKITILSVELLKDAYL